MVTELKKYFPEISSEQLKSFETLNEIYPEINNLVNLISRKNIDQLFEQHILHSLSIQKFHYFKDGQNVVDIGTGGGFPGIPLAIMNPNTHFHLVDSIGKKIRAVQEICDTLELKNVSVTAARVEEMPMKFDLALVRAVAQSDKLFFWMKKKWVKGPHMLLLKGGDLREEMLTLRQSIHGKIIIREKAISDYFPGEFFDTKKIIEITK